MVDVFLTLPKECQVVLENLYQDSQFTLTKLLKRRNGITFVIFSW